MNRPRPLDFKTEREFLDAVAAYVKAVTVANRAYGKKIDSANDFRSGAKAIVRRHIIKRTEKQDRTLHDVLQANPVLLTMYKQGRLF